MVKIPKPIDEMQTTLTEGKKLIARLDKGQKIIQESIQTGSVNRAFEAIRLYNKLAIQLNDNLENALFIHEQIATGRSTVINRGGYPVNASTYRNDQYMMVDLWTLNSLKQLRDFFGEEYVEFVEFESN
jgi:hypothetical protein